MLYVTTRISRGNSASARQLATAIIAKHPTARRTVVHNFRVVLVVPSWSISTLNSKPSTFQLIQRLLRLSIVFATHRHSPIVFRRAIKFRRKRLGVLRRKRPIDRSRELFVLVNVNHIIRRRRLGSPILVERLLRFISTSLFAAILLNRRALCNLRVIALRFLLIFVNEIKVLVVQIVLVVVGHGA